MTKKDNSLFKKLDKMENAIMGLLTVYGPSLPENIQEDIEYFFPKLASFSNDYLNEILEGLYKAKIIDRYKGNYSVIPFNVIKKIDKAMETMDSIYVGDKEFTSKEINEFGSFEGMINGPLFSKLKKFIDKYVSNNEVVDKLKNNIVMFPYLFFDTEQVLNIVKKEFKVQFDEEEFRELYKEYFENVPRYFYGGFSFAEYNERVLEVCPNLERYKREDELIEKYPPKKEYKKFTYPDLIDLASDIIEAKPFEIIDSDRILELTINNKKVYTQILGFYKKDLGIIIYPNKEELLYTYHFALAEPGQYLDAALRMSVIEVCLNDPGGFANEQVLYDLNKNHYPECPSFIRLIANHNNRLINEEEIQIVGGVLSDLLRYFKNNSRDEISKHLGYKLEDDFDIDQLYITDKETLYGGYNEIGLAEPFLNYKSNNVDKKKVKELKKYKKTNVSVGCYIYPSIIENDELPYVLILKDDDNDMIIDMFLKRIDEMPDIKNHLLDVLSKNKICPKGFYVNNDYTFEMFDEFIDYFDDYDYCSDSRVDDVYEEMSQFEFDHSDDVDISNFS